VQTLVGASSPARAATKALRERFGDDAIIVLVRGDLQKLVLSQDIERLLELEGCIAGNPPPGATPPGGPRGPCARLARSRPVKVVVGPGTFVNTVANEVRARFERSRLSARVLADAADATARNRARRDGLGRAVAARRGARARKAVEERFTQELFALAARYGFASLPQLDDPSFVSALVFDATKRPGTPKRKFAYLFPASASGTAPGRAALVQVRLKAGLSDARRVEAIRLVRAAVAMPRFKPRNGATYTVTGAPVVASDLAASIGGSLRTLLVVALIVMAATLMLVFGVRPRLLPLGLALVAVAMTFGALSLVGASLTIASIAVLPVLIGLAVDYAIQLQSRIVEERGVWRKTGRMFTFSATPLAQDGVGKPLGVAAAARRAALLGAPAIATAAAATAAGFAVLASSPVPMVRGFGLLLVVGIAIAFATALLAGTAALVVADRRAAATSARRGEGRDRVAATTAGGESGGGVAVREPAGPRGDPGEAIADHGGVAVREPAGPRGHPGEAIADHGGVAVREPAGPRGDPGGVIAERGGVAAREPAGPFAGARLVASDAARVVGRAGAAALAFAIDRPGRVLAIGLAVAAAGWALDTQTRVESDIQRLVPQDMRALRDLDALQRSTGVGGEVDVVVEGRDLTSPAAIAWMTAFQSAVLEEHGFSARRGCGQAELCPAFSLPDLFSTPASRGDATAIDTLLDVVPPYLSRSVITADRRTATLAFGIRLMALDEQKRVVDAMRARLDDERPPGLRAQVAGLPVLAADANAAVSSSLRRVLTLLAGLVAVGIVLLVMFRDLERAVVALVPIALATGWSALVLFCLRIPLNPMSVTLGALVIAISTEFSVLLSERYREERARGHDPAEALRRTYRSTGAAVLASGATAIAGFAVLVASDVPMLRDFGFVTVVDLTISLLGVLFVLPAALLLSERRRASLAGVAAPAGQAR
jgi:predicted RND superfamily exporter protein